MTFRHKRHAHHVVLHQDKTLTVVTPYIDYSPNKVKVKGKLWQTRLRNKKLKLKGKRP
jgi:hypothetical protein